MECKNCPYGCYDYERRMANYNKIVTERGIPNDIYHYLEPQDASAEFEQFIWCDKVGGKVYWAGCCEDAYTTGGSEGKSRRKSNKKRKRSNSQMQVDYQAQADYQSNRGKRGIKRERDLKYKRHLESLAKQKKGYYTPVAYLDKVWVDGYGLVENPKPYYKRYYRGKCSKYFKRYSNKKIRRYKGEIGNGFQCHRLFDFWWELW